MSIETINGHMYRVLLCGGLKRLEEKCDQINKMNVFPVPDGDTGDNMLMTIQSGLAQTVADEDMRVLCEALSTGMLYGARGNSGVILSRFFYGLNQHIAACEDPITTDDMAVGLQQGVSEAYAAVSNPKEGTILTVMRETTDAVRDKAPADFEAFFNVVIPAAAEALQKTPEQLDVLKNAGVVDSGGAGFLCILEGMKTAFENGESYIVTQAKTTVRELTDQDEMLGYCTEFILQRMRQEPFSLDQFKQFLNEAGSSVVAFESGHIVKVHVHTFHPEEVLARAHRYGEFLTLKIENMTIMHSESTVESQFEIPQPKSRYGLVAVACGSGVQQMLKNSGCTVVDGSRSMNPSAQDILDGIRRAHAETVFVFPNHKNVLLAANQAKAMWDDGEVVIIPSEDIGQCYHAISFFDEGASVDELTSRFQAAQDVGRTVQLSKAIRPCTDNGIEVREGDWICFDRNAILIADRDEISAALRLLEGCEEAPEVVIILFGEDRSQADAEALETCLADRFPETEFIVINGGQPIYHYTFIMT